MRVRVRRHVPWQALGILTLIVAPIVTVGIPAVIFTDGLNRMGEIFINPYYNTTTFLDVNFSRLGQMADVFEDRLVKYHLPLNYTCTTTFNPADYETPISFGGGGDTAIQTGLGLATQCFRYDTYVREGNITGVAESLEVIRNLTDGVAMLLAVPNGGIGPDYPGILARVVAPPEASLPLGAMQGLALKDSPFNGSGPYSQWKWDGATSKDQHSGVFFGLGMVLKFISAPDILSKARLCVDQLVHGYLQTGWLGIDGTGLPTGVVLNSNIIGSSEWVLCLLRLGATAFPEKYARLYYHYATSEFYLSKASGGSVANLMMDYYANTFFLHVMGALILLEDDSNIREVYIEKFIEPFWKLIRYHRNAYFNSMYVMITNSTNSTSHPVIHDIGDQLMRFAINRFPERNLNINPVPSWFTTTPDDFRDEIFKNNAFASIYQSIPGVYDKFESKYFLQPRTVDCMQWDWYIWQRNPFSFSDYDANYASLYNTGWVESHGLAFTAPYWISRWAGVIPAEGLHLKEAFVDA